jgi:hypothetical protein
MADIHLITCPATSGNISYPILAVLGRTGNSVFVNSFCRRVHTTVERGRKKKKRNRRGKTVGDVACWKSSGVSSDPTQIFSTVPPINSIQKPNVGFINLIKDIKQIKDM